MRIALALASVMTCNLLSPECALAVDDSDQRVVTSVLAAAQSDDREAFARYVSPSAHFAAGDVGGYPLDLKSLHEMLEKCEIGELTPSHMFNPEEAFQHAIDVHLTYSRESDKVHLKIKFFVKNSMVTEAVLVAENDG